MVGKRFIVQREVDEGKPLPGREGRRIGCVGERLLEMRDTAEEGETHAVMKMRAGERRGGGEVRIGYCCCEVIVGV